MSTPRLKQILELAGRQGGVRANKETCAHALIYVSTMCQYLRRYTKRGLLFRHGEQGCYWYTLTPQGKQTLENVGLTLGRHNDDRTVTGRVRRYFLANPEEEMSFDDLAVKLGLSTKHLSWCVKLLSAQGLLESLHVVRVQPEARARLRA